MAATTVNISATYSTAKSQDLTYSTATTGDKVILIVYNGGSAILIKKTVNIGGSADEIAITASTKYIAKFTANDLAIIPNGATYKAYLYTNNDTLPEEIFNGTFTVASATISVATQTPDILMKQVAEVFDSNGDTTYTFPANCVLHGVLIFAKGGSPIIDLDDADATKILDNAQTVQDAWTYFEVNKFLHAGTSDVVSISSTDWESSDLKVIFIFYTVSI